MFYNPANIILKHYSQFSLDIIYIVLIDILHFVDPK